jgi:toxin HigB-1
MIKNFRHKGIRKFFETGSTAGIQTQHATRLQIQLAALNRAIKPDDMNAPGWKLHSLKGHNQKNQDVRGHWSVSVSGNWRLTFQFENEDVILVDYQDYH